MTKLHGDIDLWKGFLSLIRCEIDVAHNSCLLAKIRASRGISATFFYSLGNVRKAAGGKYKRYRFVNMAGGGACRFASGRHATMLSYRLSDFVK
jgi:hypothetical protein